jgi:hypothetical protein
MRAQPHLLQNGGQEHGICHSWAYYSHATRKTAKVKERALGIKHCDTAIGIAKQAPTVS